MALKFFIVADVHGRFDNVVKLFRHMRRNGFNLKKNPSQRLIQLGDRCDRGPDSYRVNAFFKRLQERYPNQVIVIRGNHEEMMLDFAKGHDQGFQMNGGNATIKSYAAVGRLYGKHVFVKNLINTGHAQWHQKQKLFHETEDYFFSHAPIPYADLRVGMMGRIDFRKCQHTLTWSFGNGQAEHRWVDKDPTGEGKICVYGHVHGMYSGRLPSGETTLVIPGVRRYGNAILADTGSGCVKGGVGILSCVMLPEMVAIDSIGNKYEIKDSLKEEVGPIKVGVV